MDAPLQQGHVISQRCTTRSPDPAPERVISGPESRLKSRRINLNFIELLAIIKIITIQNTLMATISNHKQQKGQLNKKVLVFYTRLEKVQIIILSSALEALKFIHCGPWLKKVVHLCQIRCVYL